jgi:hypothetical protein
MRRITAAVSAALLVLFSVAIAEAALFALLILFAFVLKLFLAIELGAHFVQVLSPGTLPFPEVSIRNAATVGSCLFTLAFAFGAATWRHRRWRPPA